MPPPARTGGTMPTQSLAASNLLHFAFGAMHQRLRARTRKAACDYQAEALEDRQLLSTTIYVDVTAPGPLHDGLTWGTAYTNLQQALNAVVPTDQVRVAD